MRLTPAFKQALEGFYVYHAVPTDQLKRQRGVLRMITDAFNGVCDTRYEPDLLLRYMINRRKNSDWPRLAERARRFESPVSLLTDHQLTVLEDIYVRLDITSDEYLYGAEFSRMLVAEFGKRTAVIMPGPTLVAVIVAKRKRGEWVTIREEVEKENKAASGAFTDIEEADRIFKQKRKNG